MSARSFATALALAALAPLAACGEKTVGPTGVTPTQPFGRLRVVNAVRNATIADRVNVSVDGVPFAVNLAYGAVAPSGTVLYYPVYEGSRQATVRRTADTTVKVLDEALTGKVRAAEAVAEWANIACLLALWFVAGVISGIAVTMMVGFGS